MSETVTVSREVLLDLLTTAALIGRAQADKIQTRGDAAHELTLYGYAGRQLDSKIRIAERGLAREGK